MKVKVGFLGCGGIAHAHMERLARMEDVEIVAFCDVVKERAEESAKKYGGRAYTDHHEMLDKEKLDALYVALPPVAHTDGEIIAAEKKIHIFVEKPIALTLEKAKEINEAIKKAGVISSVGYHFRYMDTVEEAKKLVEGKTIGMILGYWIGGFPGVYWWRRMDMSGGQIVEQTTHIFDLARYFCGDVDEVYAAYGRKILTDIPESDVPDVGTVTMKFKDGTVGTVSNSCMISQGFRVGVELFLRDLVLEVGWRLRIIEPDKTIEKNLKVDPYWEEDRIFIDAIKTGDASKIKSPYEDGLKSLAVSLAANKSWKEGKAVKVEI